MRYVPTANVNIILLGEMTSRGYKYMGIRKACKVYKGNHLILQGRKDQKNICHLEGHSMRELPNSKIKMKIEHVKFFGNLAQGRICYVCEPSPTSMSLKKEGEGLP